MTKESSESAVDKAIISLGSVNADFQVRIERRPEISETVIARDFRRLSGGKAANVAFLARKLGCRAVLVARVGDDDLAEQALGPLRAIGVDLSHVKTVPNHATGVSMITVPPDGKKGIVLAANANEAWGSEDVTAVGQLMSQVSSESLLVLDCEIATPVLEKAAESVKQLGCQVILDPSPADRVSDALLAAADFIVPNASEAESLTGIACTDIESACRAGRRLLERGASAVCVKLPDGGCVLIAEEGVIHVGTADVEVVDTTGAGDAFAGALAVALLNNMSRIEAVKFAVAASHLAVTGYGSQPAYPSRDAIQRMANDLSVDTDVDKAP